uniref:peptidylprolyl isomerase n=1 Tax=Theileria annulata TaxID=5874 RepID=A0A3B0MTC8_THEAN
METQGEISPTEKEALAKEFRDLEEIRTREAKSRAVVLEILGDIPDADITPPKNVLFVCKLNPVTEEKDLKIIFSRFGNVRSCDIIKDYVTGDSLQYGFIEFETEESCNEAYFKMQNVLIDDRRLVSHEFILLESTLTSASQYLVIGNVSTIENYLRERNVTILT